MLDEYGPAKGAWPQTVAYLGPAKWDLTTQPYGGVWKVVGFRGCITPSGGVEAMDNGAHRPEVPPPGLVAEMSSQGQFRY